MDNQDIVEVHIYSPHNSIFERSSKKELILAVIASGRARAIATQYHRGGNATKTITACKQTVVIHKHTLKHGACDKWTSHTNTTHCTKWPGACAKCILLDRIFYIEVWQKHLSLSASLCRTPAEGEIGWRFFSITQIMTHFDWHPEEKLSNWWDINRMNKTINGNKKNCSHDPNRHDHSYSIRFLS